MHPLTRKRTLGLLAIAALVGMGTLYAVSNRTVSADVVNGITTTDVVTPAAFDAGSYTDTMLGAQGELQLKEQE